MNEALEAFLVDFHDRLPGGSSAAFGALAVQDEAGRTFESSYHALASRLAAAPAGPVLDLACGDGHLLALLAGSGRARIGIDMSTGELRAARARLGADVPLHQARAQALPLANASLAAVTCHMALMLMAEAPQVLAEISRALQPGGHLLAVVPAAPVGAADRCPAVAAFHAALDAQPRQAGWQGVRFDVVRPWRDAAGVAALLQPHFARWQTTRLQGEQRLTAAQAWAWFTGLYDLHLLPPAAWAPAETAFHAHLAPRLDADGRTALPHAYLLIDATLAAPGQPLPETP
jgi:SAM-dependent methyltransferase